MKRRYKSLNLNTILNISQVIIVLCTISLGIKVITEKNTIFSLKEFSKDNNITVLSREEGSGTRGAFIELFGIEKKNSSGEKIDYTTDEAMVTNSTSVMMTSIASDMYGIGYVSLGFLNDSVKGLKIDGVFPSVENIKLGEYKIVRPFNIVTTNKDLSESAKDFINFILSNQGQSVISENGFISISDLSDYDVKKIKFEKVVVSGSSSVSPVMEKIKELYQVYQPKSLVEIQQTDSTTGITSVLNEICDIGMSSRNLKSSEISNGALQTLIAQDGIAVVINKSNPLDSVSTKQVCDVFTGNTLKWNELIEN